MDWQDRQACTRVQSTAKLCTKSKPIKPENSVHVSRAPCPCTKAAITEPPCTFMHTSVYTHLYNAGEF